MTDFSMSDSEERALLALWQRGRTVRPLALAIERAHDWRERLRAIRAYYEAVRPEIDAAQPYEWAYDVYEVDWPALFTPIESAIWSDVRGLGLVLYPQFPMEAGGHTYFADFASPRRKVCIECDGKAFHDPKVDAIRDSALSLAGWAVYRFTGAQCRQDGSVVGRELEKIARHHLGEIDLSVRLPMQRNRGFDE